jgi:multidrug efflux pump subunit AcrA (membrane-fusion protein)
MKFYQVFIYVIVAGLLLTACSGSTPTSATTPVPAVNGEPALIVDGNVAPRQFTTIGFGMPGQVAEVLVAEGDAVVAGQVIARLANREAADAEIARTELEKLLAQQAVDALYENPDLAQTQALSALTGAYDAVRLARIALDEFEVPADQADLTPLAAVEQTQVALDAARRANGLSSTSSQENDPLKQALDDAQQAYDDAVNRLKLETDLTVMTARLTQARKDYAASQAGPDANAVLSAQARLDAAQAMLAAAQAARQNLDLHAPFSGTVTSLNLKASEFVAAGQPVVTLADLSTWVVETQDLSELEVVKVQEGQLVTVRMDAVPGQSLTGKVQEISYVAVNKQGEITYTVTILLAGQAPGMRWGMTAEVSFEHDTTSIVIP